MKRFLFLCALVGALPFAATAAAAPVDPGSFLPVMGVAALAGGSPPRVVLAAVQTPMLPRYSVAAGDTLWSIGIRYHRSWAALAAFNRVPDPNLIYVDQVITIPPANYTPPAAYVAPVAPSYRPPPVAQHTTSSYTPAPQPVVSAPVVNRGGGAPGSFQSCVAWRESGNGSGSSNIYGFLPSTWSSLGLSGSPGSASRATQDAAFAQLYARDGASPWAPYDGC